jgi:tRNA(Ile)-lysidine synthetase-like protein
MIRYISNCLERTNRYCIAVSMGVDSVAALLFLKCKGFDLLPLHFNHKLRKQNDEMQHRFIELCNFLNLDYRVGTGINLQTEVDCRNARLKFYGTVADQGTIITAHHLNDWVENYLLNCFRGHPHHKPFELENNFTNFTVVHPFLLTRKRDFIQYLERNHSLRFVVEDESNSLIKGSRRNWIRNSIVPEMTNHKISLEKYAKRKIYAEIERKSEKEEQLKMGR